jgi:hypothetical protein
MYLKFCNLHVWERRYRDRWGGGEGEEAGCEPGQYNGSPELGQHSRGWGPGQYNFGLCQAGMI